MIRRFFSTAALTALLIAPSATTPASAEDLTNLTPCPNRGPRQSLCVWDQNHNEKDLITRVSFYRTGDGTKVKISHYLAHAILFWHSPNES